MISKHTDAAQAFITYILYVSAEKAVRMQALAECLGVPADALAEWRGVALLEQALPRASGEHASTSDAQGCGAAAARAAAVLQACARPQQALYCAQLLVALQQPELAVRQLQRVASALLTQPPSTAGLHLEVQHFRHNTDSTASDSAYPVPAACVRAGRPSPGWAWVQPCVDVQDQCAVVALSLQLLPASTALEHLRAFCALHAAPPQRARERLLAEALHEAARLDCVPELLELPFTYEVRPPTNAIPTIVSLFQMCARARTVRWTFERS